MYMCRLHVKDSIHRLRHHLYLIGLKQLVHLWEICEKHLNKDSVMVEKPRDEYIKSICCTKNHKKVFADEKPMKEQDLFTLVK